MNIGLAKLIKVPSLRGPKGRSNLKTRTLVTGALALCVGMTLLLCAAPAEAAVKYWVGPSNGSFTADTNWSTISGGANNTTAPGSGDTATFDSGGNNSCTFNASRTIGGLDIQSTYTGIFTINSDVTVTKYGNGPWTVNGGTMSAASGSTVLFHSGTFTITGSHTLNNVTFGVTTEYGPNVTIASGTTLTVAGTLTMQSYAYYYPITLNTGTIAAQGDIVQAAIGGVKGTATILINGTGNQTFTGNGVSGLPKIDINKPSGTLLLAGTIRVANTGYASYGSWTYTAGTVDPGTSTVIFTGYNENIAITGSQPWNNVTIAGSGANYLNIASGSTMTVNGTLTLSSTTVNTGTIAAKGDIVQGTSGCTGSATILINGTGNQTFTGGGTSASLPSIEINKPSGTLTLAGTINTTGSGARSWTYTAGTIDPGTSTVIFFGDRFNQGTITGSHTLYNVTFKGGGSNVQNIASDTTLTVNGTLTLDSTGGGSQLGGFINGGTIAAQGDIVQGTYGASGNATLLINGTGNQLLTGGGASATLPHININKPSGTLTLSGTIGTPSKDYGTTSFIYTAGTVDPGTSTVIFQAYYGTQNISGSFPLNNVTFTGYGTVTNIASGSTLTVNGTLTLTSGTVNTGTIAAQGDIVQGAGGSYGSATILINGTGNQTFTGGGTSAYLPSVNINKPSGTLTLSGVINAKSYANNSWTYTAGTVDAGTSTVRFDANGYTHTITGSHTLNNVAFIYRATIASGTTLTVAGTLTLDASTTAGGQGSNWLSTGTIEAKGDIIQGTYGMSGTATVLINGTGDQTFTGGGASACLPKIEINKPSGTLFLAGTIGLKNTNYTAWGSWVCTAGTIDPGTSTMLFHGYNEQWTVTGSQTWNNVTFSGVSSDFVTISADTTMTVNGTLTLNSGFSVSGGTISAKGDIVQSASGIQGTATILINGTGNQTFTGGGMSAALPAININKPSGTLYLVGTIGVAYGHEGYASTNCWTYTAGTVDPGTSTVRFYASYKNRTITGSHALNNVIFYPAYGGIINISSGTILTVAGTLTIDSDGYSRTLNGGTIEAKGDIVQGTYGASGNATILINGTGNQAWSSSGGAIPGSVITINKPSGTVTLGSNVALNTSGQDLTVTAGTLDLATYALTVNDVLTNNGTILAGTAATPITAGTLTSANVTSQVTYSGTGTVNVKNGTYGNITVNGAGTYSLQGATTLLGNLTIGNDSVLNTGYNLTVPGNWSSQGTFSATAGTVTLNGTNQTISGTNTFYNLAKTVASPYTLTLPAGLTTTVTNALTLSGTDINTQLALRSSTSGTAALLTLSTGATQSLNFLDVKDNNASGGQQLTAYNSTDAGNNTNWQFLIQDDILDGIVGYWHFEEASGSLVDSSGSGNNGTANGGVTYGAVGRIGNCLSFDGSNDYVALASNPALTDGITVAAWIYMRANAVSWPGIISRYGAWSLYFQSGTTNMSFYPRWQGPSITINNTVTLNNWHHVAATYSQSSGYSKIYVDGQNVLTSSQQSNAIGTSGESTYIGKYYSGGYYFNGLIDEVRVYNRALSEAEVTSVYNYGGGSGGTGVLTLKDTATNSTSVTNSRTVTATFSTLESTVTGLELSNDNTNWTTVSGYTAGQATATTTWTLLTGDGTKYVYARITKGSTVYKITGHITLDMTPPAAPANLTLTAGGDSASITGAVVAPADSDVSQLIWRYNAVVGNVAPSYPSTSSVGTAFGAGSSTGVTASSSKSIAATGLTQLKTYCVRVWAVDTAGNISTTAAQNYLYLSPPTPRLVITAPSNAATGVAGTALTLTITAKDASGNTITNYAGPYTLTWTPTGSSATTLVSASSSDWSSGITTAAVNIGGSSAGDGTFTATDNSTSELTSGTRAFTFYPASFTVAADAASQTAGKPFNLTITAKDAAGATVTRYSGAAALSVTYTAPATGTRSLSTISVAASKFTSGAATTSISYPDAGKITIKAADTTYITGVTIQGTSSELTFNPSKITVTFSPPPGSRSGFYPNEGIATTIVVKDYNDSITPNYRGTIGFASQAGMTVPANYVYAAADNGSHMFTGISSAAAGSYTITATDAAAATITGVSTPITVINAKLVIPNVSGAVGALAGGCYILNTTTNQVVSSDNTTTVALSMTEATANNTAVLNKTGFTVKSGAGEFSIADTEGEAVTVTAVTNPTLPVQSGTFTFGASSATGFRIEYNFEVTNYTTPITTTTPATTTTTPTTYTPVYVTPTSQSYNQAGMYDSAVSSGHYNYSMAAQAGTGYHPAASGSYGQTQGSAPTYVSPGGTTYAAPVSGTTYTAPSSGGTTYNAPSNTGMTYAPSGDGSYGQAQGPVSTYVAPSGMTYTPPSGGTTYNIPSGAGTTFAPGTSGQGYAPGTFGPPAGIKGGEAGGMNFSPPPSGGMDFGAVSGAFTPMFGPPKGVMGGKEGKIDFGSFAGAFNPMFGPPEGQAGQFGMQPSFAPGKEGKMDFGSFGEAFNPMFGPPEGQQGQGMFGPPQGMPGEGSMWGPPQGMIGEGGMWGPPPGQEGMMMMGPEGGMEEKKETEGETGEGAGTTGVAASSEAVNQ